MTSPKSWFRFWLPLVEDLEDEEFRSFSEAAFLLLSVVGKILSTRFVIVDKGVLDPDDSPGLRSVCGLAFSRDDIVPFSNRETFLFSLLDPDRLVVDRVLDRCPDDGGDLRRSDWLDVLVFCCCFAFFSSNHNRSCSSLERSFEPPSMEVILVSKCFFGLQYLFWRS